MLKGSVADRILLFEKMPEQLEEARSQKSPPKEILVRNMLFSPRMAITLVLVKSTWGSIHGSQNSRVELESQKSGMFEHLENTKNLPYISS